MTILKNLVDRLWALLADLLDEAEREFDKACHPGDRK
jgi:hypothetical protein